MRRPGRPSRAKRSARPSQGASPQSEVIDNASEAARTVASSRRGCEAQRRRAPKGIGENAARERPGPVGVNRKHTVAPHCRALAPPRLVQVLQRPGPAQVLSAHPPPAAFESGWIIACRPRRVARRWAVPANVRPHGVRIRLEQTSDVYTGMLRRAGGEAVRAGNAARSWSQSSPPSPGLPLPAHAGRRGRMLVRIGATQCF